MNNMRKLFLKHSNILNETQSKLNFNEPSMFSSKQMQKAISQIRQSLSQSHIHKQSHPFSPSFSMNSFSSNTNNNTNNNSTYYTSLSKTKTMRSLMKTIPLINQYKMKQSNMNVEELNTIKMNEALYKKIFPKIYVEKTEEINNLHNIIYSESPKQFEKQFAQMKWDREEGKILNYHGTQIDSGPVFKRMDYIKSQLHFYRSISEYVYPQVVVMKIKEKQKAIRERRLNKRNEEKDGENGKIVKSLSTGCLDTSEVYTMEKLNKTNRSKVGMFKKIRLRDFMKRGLNNMNKGGYKSK